MRPPEDYIFGMKLLYCTVLQVLASFLYYAVQFFKKSPTFLIDVNVKIKTNNQVKQKWSEQRTKEAP